MPSHDGGAPQLLMPHGLQPTAVSCSYGARGLVESVGVLVDLEESPSVPGDGVGLGVGFGDVLGDWSAGFGVGLLDWFDVESDGRVGA